MSRTIKYPLSHVRDCLDHENRKILAFEIRTTDGTDELYASKRADSKGTNMTEELIRFSIVSYTVMASGGTDEDIRVVIDHKKPFEDFDKWSTKARNFVVAAWKKLATPDDAELADFFANATEVE
jgi:hypothetical protein